MNFPPLLSLFFRGYGERIFRVKACRTGGGGEDVVWMLNYVKQR